MVGLWIGVALGISWGCVACCERFRGRGGSRGAARLVGTEPCLAGLGKLGEALGCLRGPFALRCCYEWLLRMAIHNSGREGGCYLRLGVLVMAVSDSVTDGITNKRFRQGRPGRVTVSDAVTNRQLH